MLTFRGRNLAPYAAEFVGTFLLVFTVGLNALVGSKIWMAVSVASVLVVAVYCFASTSGAHFNPAVSVAAGLAGKKPWREVAIYCGVQVAAGILAALAYSLVLWETFTLSPGKGYHFWEVGLVEMLYTAMLCFVVLQVDPQVQLFLDAESNLNNTAAGNQYYGLAIGFVLVAAIGAGGHISGGCYNPALALGIDVSSMLLGFRWWICYVFFEMLGAALGFALFRLTDILHMRNSYRGTIGMRSILLSEFAGAFFIVLTAGLCVLGGSSTTAISVAAAVMCMIFAVGRISGGHLNPAVTVAVLCRGREISPAMAAKYIGVQFLGGLLGAVVYAIVEHGRTFPLFIGRNFKVPHVMVVEFLGTFLLCSVVLAVATVLPGKRLTQFYALAIGLSILGAGEAISCVSGGVLNPAVALGVATTGAFSRGHFWYVVPFVASELLAGAAAAGVFRLTRPSEYLLTK